MSFILPFFWEVRLKAVNWLKDSKVDWLKSMQAFVCDEQMLKFQI